jgi:hypothetical protein
MTKPAEIPLKTEPELRSRNVTGKNKVRLDKPIFQPQPPPGISHLKADSHGLPERISGAKYHIT